MKTVATLKVLLGVGCELKKPLKPNLRRKTVTKWIRKHIHTIAALLAVFLVVLAGIIVGGIVAFLSGFWLIASGSMDGMVITSWGY